VSLEPGLQDRDPESDRRRIFDAKRRQFTVALCLAIQIYRVRRRGGVIGRRRSVKYIVLAPSVGAKRPNVRTPTGRDVDECEPELCTQLGQVLANVYVELK